jgi:hypothetical protein
MARVQRTETKNNSEGFISCIKDTKNETLVSFNGSGNPETKNNSEGIISCIKDTKNKPLNFSYIIYIGKVKYFKDLK